MKKLSLNILLALTAVTLSACSSSGSGPLDVGSSTALPPTNTTDTTTASPSTSTTDTTSAPSTGTNTNNTTNTTTAAPGLGSNSTDTNSVITGDVPVNNFTALIFGTEDEAPVRRPTPTADVLPDTIYLDNATANFSLDAIDTAQMNKILFRSFVPTASVATSISDASFNTITVDGKDITLSNSDKFTTGLGDADVNASNPLLGVTSEQGNTSPGDITLRNLSYAVYGDYVNSDSTHANIDNYFSQGLVTAAENMPTTGSATYSGYAVVSGQDVARHIVTSSFDVNFETNSLTGLVNSTYGDIGLKASITGNSFAGVSGTTYTTGRFYGPSGQELSGSFVNGTRNYGGSFGATKQ